jgi:hypothetical protein
MARKRASGGGSREPAPSPTGEITADASLAQAQKNAAYFKKLLTDMHAHGGMGDEVREADYKGHHIVIQTAYTITVDGRPFEAGLGVTNDGSVHYHGMPNVNFDSAIELMKAVIDTFSDEFADGGGHGGHEDAGGGHDHGEHDHGEAHDHGGMRKARSPKGRAGRAKASAGTRATTTAKATGTRAVKRARR